MLPQPVTYWKVKVLIGIVGTAHTVNNTVTLMRIMRAGNPQVVCNKGFIVSIYTFLVYGHKRA